MISDLFGIVKNFFAAMASGLGLLQAREQRNNSPEMQRAAEGKKDQEVLDATAQAIENQDLERLRRLNS